MKVKVPLVLAFTFMKTVPKEFGENLSHKISPISFFRLNVDILYRAHRSHLRQTDYLDREGESEKESGRKTEREGGRRDSERSLVLVSRQAKNTPAQ